MEGFVCSSPGWTRREIFAFFCIACILSRCLSLVVLIEVDHIDIVSLGW